MLTELDAYLWSDFKHTRAYSEEHRSAEVTASNAKEIDGASKMKFLLSDLFFNTLKPRLIFAGEINFIV